MDIFNKITDFLQRVNFWMGITPLLIGVCITLTFSDLLGIFLIFSGIVLFIWRFLIWVKGRKKSPYISFADTINEMASTGYYDVNGHAEMWENPALGITKESYYKNLLIQNIEEKTIVLYGINQWPKTCTMEVIDPADLSPPNELVMESDGTYSIYSRLKEIKYANLSCKRDEVKTQIEMLKSSLFSN